MYFINLPESLSKLSILIVAMKYDDATRLSYFAPMSKLDVAPICIDLKTFLFAVILSSFKICMSLTLVSHDAYIYF